jgi:hypothetical protein
MMRYAAPGYIEKSWVLDDNRSHTKEPGLRPLTFVCRAKSSFQLDVARQRTINLSLGD